MFRPDSASVRPRETYVSVKLSRGDNTKTIRIPGSRILYNTIQIHNTKIIRIMYCATLVWLWLVRLPQCGPMAGATGSMLLRFFLSRLSLHASPFGLWLRVGGSWSSTGRLPYPSFLPALVRRLMMLSVLASEYCFPPHPPRRSG